MKMQNKYTIQYVWGDEKKSFEEFFSEVAFQTWYRQKVYEALQDCYGADYEIQKND